MARNSGMPIWGNIGGQLADLFIPGDAFNPNAPSFGQGWTGSGWGRGLSGAQQGNYSPLLGEIGAIAGSRAIPFVGGAIGRRAGTFLGSLFGSNGRPEFSNYGPYAAGYRGLGDMAPAQDFIMPDFTGGTDNYGAEEGKAPDYVGPYSPAMYGLSSGNGGQGFGMSPGSNMSGFGMSALGSMFNGSPISAMGSIRSGTSMGGGGSMGSMNQPGLRGKVKLKQ